MSTEAEQFGEILDSIHKGGLPVSYLAAMTRVSGTKMRKWLLASARPEHGEAQRLKELLPVIDAAFHGNFRILLRLWRVETEPGVSLGALLSSERVDLVAVSRVLQELAPAIARYARYDDAPNTKASGRNPLLDEWPVVTIDRD